MKDLSSMNILTIPTSEIPSRLRAKVHFFADAIAYGGELFLVLNVEEEENNLYIIRQVGRGLHCQYTEVSDEEGYRIAEIYLERRWKEPGG